MANRIIGNPKITWIMLALLVIALAYSGFTFASGVRQPAEPVEVVAVRERAFDVSAKQYKPKQSADLIEDSILTSSNSTGTETKDSRKTPEVDTNVPKKEDKQKSPGLVSSAVRSLISLIR